MGQEDRYDKLSEKVDELKDELKEDISSIKIALATQAEFNKWLKWILGIVLILAAGGNIENVKDVISPANATEATSSNP